MLNTHGPPEHERDISGDFALWLVNNAAALSAAPTLEAIHDITRNALGQLGLHVDYITNSDFECQDGVTNTPVIEIGSGSFTLLVAVADDHINLDRQTCAAIEEYSACATPILARFKTGPLGNTPGLEERDLDELSILLAQSGDPTTLLPGVFNLACAMFQPLAAAIALSHPLTVLESQNEDLFESQTGEFVSLSQVAASMLEGLAASGSTSFVQTIDNGTTEGIQAVAVRLSVDSNEPLALILCFQGGDPCTSEADIARLSRFADVTRASGTFKSLVVAGESNHRYLTALNEATLAAASTHDLHKIYEAIRDAVSKVMPADALLIAMIPPDSEEGVCVYRSEGSTSYFNRALLSQPFQTAMKLGRPFIIQEIPAVVVAADYRFGDPTKRVQSLAGAPLMSNNEVSGLIVSQSYETGAFRVEHADLLLDIGRSIAVALERAQLLDRLRTRSFRESALRSLTQKLTSSLNISDMLELVVDEMSTVLDETFIAAIGVDSSVVPSQVSLAFRDPEALRTDLGIHDDGSLEPGGLADTILTSRARRSDISGELSFTAIPLHEEAECIGAMVFARRARIPFSDDEQSTFAILEGIVVSAVRNARHYRARKRDESDLLEVERISRLVASSLNTEDILAEILASLPKLFQSEGCSVRIVDGTDLVPLAVHGEIVHTFADRVPLGTSLAGAIVRDQRLLAVDDLHAHPATGRHARSTGVKVRGWLAAPMIDSSGEVFGILSIHSDYPRRWSKRDRVLLQTLAESTTVAIQNAWRFRKTRDVLLASVESLANAVDAKDPTTLNHSRNVSTYARKIAEAIGASGPEVESVALAGLLHDIGKIGIPDRILQKPDTLDGSEWEELKTHPVIGEQILSGNVHLSPVLEHVRHHHERWDGMGYPDGLRGEAIPLGASIVALADAIDTMASERPYRRALPWPHVCKIIRTEAGKQFDPRVTEAFLRLAESGQLESLSDARDNAVAVQFDAQMHSHSLDARALMIFHGIAREVRALTDIETFIANTTLVIRSVMELSDIQIFLVDEQDGNIVYRPSNSDRARGFTDIRRKIGAGVVGWVVEHGEPLLVPDVLLDDRFISTSVSEVRSELAVPLIANDNVIGAINVESSLPTAFSNSDVRLLTAAAAHLAQSVQVARLHDTFKQLASTDSLTGLANHRAFYERLEEEIRHASITGGVLTVAIMDIDNLKMLNDTFGHLTGDSMLREVAAVLKDRCRRSDHVARYGGDEFAFILADTDLAGADRAIAHIIRGLDERTVALDGRSLSLPTGAWGSATYPHDGVRPSELVRVADQRMYANKRISKAIPGERGGSVLSTTNIR